MKTRRKRRSTVTISAANELDDADEAVINEEPAVVNEEPAQEVPIVVESPVEESTTEDGVDNRDAEISLLQVAKDKLLLIALFSYLSLIHDAYLMQRVENAVRDVRDNGISTHQSSRKHNVNRRRLTL